jgi:alpha-glucoside transport system permease protein
MSIQAIAQATGDIKPNRRRFLDHWPVRLAVGIICFLWFLPTLGLLVTSVRDPQDITQTGWWTALFNPFDLSQWTLQNYANVITADGMAQAFVNSLIVAIPATVIPITVAAFAAYAFAWMRFPFRITLFIIVVGLLVVPLQMALIPVLQVYSASGITGTFLGIWLAHTGFGLPLAVFLLYNFISQLPEDLFETASIDGATHFQVFTRIVLPLSVPALAAFAIFQFMWVWNDLLVALVFLGPQDNVAVATVKLTQIVGNRGEQWHVLTAAAFITMVLPLLVFLALQRYFIRGILAGSVKG